ncbi:MAG: SpoIIE family protein phosphatase [Acidobacteria bacterium]|nr:SpoIIE family protein phosphatase [Acidobacteriota bacterium]
MLVLEVRTPGGSIREFPLQRESTVIGRSSRADVTILDRSLSRHHARVFKQDGGWWIEDLGSRNGTLYNGQRLGSGAVRIQPGDILGLGGSSIKVTTVEAAFEVKKPSSGTTNSLFRPARELLEDSSSAQRLAAPSDEATLRRLTHRLAVLNDVQQALARPIELDELLSLILDRVFEHLRPEEGAIFLREKDGSFRCAARRPAGSEEAEQLCSYNLIQQVVEGAQAALVLDVEEDERFARAESLAAAGIRSLVAAPFLEADDTHGMIVLSSRLHTRQFTEEDLELLVSLASVAAMRIRNVRLTEEAILSRRLERDVALARRIQVAILPDHLPGIDGYELHAGNVPSRGVSGDFYKVVRRIEDREVILLLADVSGKGIGAALLTGSLEALSAGAIATGAPPEEVCATTSRLLYERTPPEKYSTLFLAELHPTEGRVIYCNAGHNPGLVVRRDGGARWLASTGPPVGLLPEATYEAATTGLEPGDTLVLYTDGITEAENHDGEEYGVERLEALCLGHRELPPRELAGAIEKDLSAFAAGTPFADDRTLLIVRRL